jgi:RNA polymerase-binding transcription factor DksA
MIFGGMGMDEKDMERLKDILLRQRLEIYDRLHGLESEWVTLSEHDIEREEEAQKADLTALFDQLDDLKKQEIENIDLALTKMTAATYGACEMCRKPISLKRLEALPAARFCKRCARKAEEKPRP